MLTFSRLGWDCNAPSGGPPSGPAGGDLAGSYPAPQIAAGVVTSSKLANSAVTNTRLADSAVTSAKLADSAVTSAKLGNLAVGNLKLADSAVGSSKLADNAVTTSKLQNGAVTGAKANLGYQMVVQNWTHTLGQGGTNHFTVSCPAGKRPLGGGGFRISGNGVVVGSAPRVAGQAGDATTGWSIWVYRSLDISDIGQPAPTGSIRVICATL